MSDHDQTGKLLSEYFADQVEAIPARTPPAVLTKTPQSEARSNVGLTVTRLLIAALVGVTIGLPLIRATTDSPSARKFADINVKLDIAGTVEDSIRRTGEFIQTHLTGGNVDD